MAVFTDLTGYKYGKLTVLNREPNVLNHSMWKCECECGNFTIVRGGAMKQGLTTSCGCVLRKIASQRFLEMHALPGYVSANKKHGLSTSSTYSIYRGMLERCYNNKLTIYKYYGGSGITVCDSWKTSFVNFLADMGERPSDEYSLERIEGSKGYEPLNVKWATDNEQARNRRMMSNNTSGKTGVGYGKANNSWYARVSDPITGKQRFRHFSIRKYGDADAYQMACDKRDEMMEEINGKGAGYSELHGL